MGKTVRKNIPGVTAKMAMNIEDKKAVVAGVSEVAKKALSAVVADSCGIQVAQMTKLRKDCRANNVYLHVVRNTLLSRAVEGTEFECLKDAFKGPSIIGLSMEHPGAAAPVQRTGTGPRRRCSPPYRKCSARDPPLLWRSPPR